MEKEFENILATWQQGDCVMQGQLFTYHINQAHPLHRLSQEWVQQVPDSEVVHQDVDGLMIITQTCDIVRNTAERPFLEVSPLVVLEDDAEFNLVNKGAKPQYVTVPGLHSHRMAADLDRIQTVEKALVVAWPRHQGCFTHRDRQTLARQLARKRDRAALPDEFKDWFKPLRNRFNRLAKTQTYEATVFHEIQEIRVTGEPSWDARGISVFLWFILKNGSPIRDRSQCLEDWLGKLKPHGQFKSAMGQIVRYAEMTAQEYVCSDPLDLDHMSPDLACDEIHD